MAEGGVFADQERKAITHDYQQMARVGKVTFAATDAGRANGVAFERFPATARPRCCR